MTKSDKRHEVLDVIEENEGIMNVYRLGRGDAVVLLSKLKIAEKHNAIDRLNLTDIFMAMVVDEVLTGIMEGKIRRGCLVCSDPVDDVSKIESIVVLGNLTTGARVVSSCVCFKCGVGDGATDRIMQGLQKSLPEFALIRGHIHEAGNA